MQEYIPIHTEHYEDHQQALAYYAGLRCFGVPREYMTLDASDDGQTTLTLYSQDGRSPPPGFPRAGEYLDAKMDSYHQAVSKIGNAMLHITGWPCQYEIRFSERAQDYVFSADVAPLRDDRDFDRKMRELDRLFRNLHRETSVLATRVERPFGATHPLSPHGDNGFSFEIPMSAAFRQLGHSKTLGAYLPATGTDGRSGQSRR